MNHLQRWLVRLTTRFVPQLRRLFDQAGGTIERLSDTLDMYREREADRRDLIQSRMAEVQEAIAMQSGGWMGVNVHEAAGAPESGAVVQLKERLAELELALEDRGWKRQLALADTEFSRWGIQQIILICRLMRIKNPLIQRGILISAYYVFANGVEVTSDDKDADAVLNAFWNDPRNANAIGLQALLKKEESTFTDGNIFFAFFSAVDDGQTLIRTIDPIEITEIITDPDDAGVPWYYRRRWAQQQFDTKTGIRQPQMQDAWYVALGYEPPPGTNEIAGVKLMRDSGGRFVEVLHEKDGDMEKWHFGCPRAYAAMDWARASKDLLTDYATRMRALARFTWDVETKGGAPAIANLKQAFATTLANDGSSIEQNPPPTTGSSWISGPGTKVTPFKTAGAITGPDEGRRLFHMVYMTFGLPETFFSDVSVGTLATATSLDRPTELMFKARQEKWIGTMRRISQAVLDRSMKAPKGRLREAFAVREKAPATSLDVPIDVHFPPIVEGDIPLLMSALVQAITLNGNPAIGIDPKTGFKAALSMVSAFANIEIDVEELTEAAYPSAKYDSLMDRTTLMKKQAELAMNPPEPVAPGGAPPARKPKPVASKESGEALAELRRALVALKERE